MTFGFQNLGFQNPGLQNLAVVMATLALSACSLFGIGDDDELPPKELHKIDETLEVKKAWSAKVGGGSKSLRLSLQPVGDGELVYAASHDGVVSAFDPEDGDRIWKVELDLVLTAGPGTGDGLVVVVGNDGDVICLNAEDGSEAWRANVAGEALASPLVANNRVVIYTIDGRLRVLSAFNGLEEWVLEQPLPALTLRGAAAPLVVGDRVIAGFDNGRLIASQLDDGSTDWEAMLSPPSGRSDLERLADIDGAMAAVGQDIYATGYQGRIASIAAESGQILWAREISTYAGLAADFSNIYVVGDDGSLVALLRRNGGDVWRQDDLLRRDPTAPTPFESAVVVGDFEGYVHFFSNIDGTPVARERVAKERISGAPVTIGNRLYVQGEGGTLTVFFVPQPDPPGDVPEIAEKET